MSDTQTLIGRAAYGAVRTTAVPFRLSALAFGAVSSVTGRTAQGLESTARRLDGSADPLAEETEEFVEDAAVSVLDATEPDEPDEPEHHEVEMITPLPAPEPFVEIEHHHDDDDGHDDHQPVPEPVY